MKTEHTDGPVKTLGVFTPYVWGEFLEEVHTSLFRQAGEFGFRILMIRAGNWKGLYQSGLSTGLCQAWIGILDCVRSELAESLLADGRPYCCLSNRAVAAGASSVRCDNAVGITEAMEALAQQGHRRFAFVGEPANSDMAERCDAFRRFHKDRGWPFDEGQVLSGTSGSIAEGWRLAQLLDERNQGCTAVIAASDLLAIGVRDYAVSQGYRIPEDLALFGFDNAWVSQEGEIQLSSVDQQVDLLVRTALAEVRRRLEDPSSGPQSLRVRPRVILRSSTHPLPKEPMHYPIPENWARETRASLSFDNEINHFLTGGFREDQVRKLLISLSRYGRQAFLSRVESDQCHDVGTNGHAVALPRFGEFLTEDPARPNDLVVIVPCQFETNLTYVLALTVPLAQVRETAILALLAHEWELTAMAIERSSNQDRLEKMVDARTKTLALALDRLENAHHRLLKGEKLAVIGQTAAKVAHEINSPLAVILSSNRHVKESLQSMTKGLVTLARTLAPPTFQTLLSLVRQEFASVPGDRRHQKQIRQGVHEALQKTSIPHQEEMADLLVELGMDSLDNAWGPLAHREDNVEIFRWALVIAEMQRSASLVGDAAQKVSQFVEALSGVADPSEPGP